MKREIERADLIYGNGFPANINFDMRVIVQVVPKPEQSVILYTCVITGKPTRCYLRYEIAEKYFQGIHEI